MSGIPLPLLALLALLLSGASAPAGGDTAETALAEPADLAAARATRERLLGEEARLREEIRATRARVDDLAARAESTGKALAATSAERAALGAEIAELRKYFLANRIAISRRAVAVYRRADISSLGGSLLAADPLAFFDHLHYGAKVLSADAAFLREHSAKVARMRRRAAELAEREAKERELSERLRVERAAHERDLARLDRLLADLHMAARALETRLAEHRSAAREIDREARALPVLPAAPGEDAPPAAPGKPPRRGAAAVGTRVDFAWPFPGRKREVLSFFGRQTDPVFQIEFTNSGIDIRAAEGDAVCAAAPGTVRYRARTPGLGFVAMIEHTPELITLYSRLAEVTVGIGQRVEAGEPVGTVGPPDKPGASPFLHFEIRRNGESVDPMDHF